MYDVVALGELLIDFTPLNKINRNPIFEQNAGGAPANVLAALSKFGKNTSFIGKIGNDQFGKFLKKTLIQANIDVKGLVFSKDVPTTLAFVHLDHQGDRSFSFYRNPGADMTLSKEDIRFDIIKNSRIFHFGSLSMTHKAAAEATLYAAKKAKDENILVSFDPNLRVDLWNDLSHAKHMIKQGLVFTDILKVSKEELFFLTEQSDLSQATMLLQEQYDIPFIFVTLGEDGCFYRSQRLTGSVAGFPVDVVDTTGAGDAFLGGILYKFLDLEKITEINEINIREIVTFANAVGALATTKKGSLSSMPTLNQVNSLLNTHNLN